jgi:hypothetical protein
MDEGASIKHKRTGKDTNRRKESIGSCAIRISKPDELASLPAQRYLYKTFRKVLRLSNLYLGGHSVVPRFTAG